MSYPKSTLPSAAKAAFKLASELQQVRESLLECSVLAEQAEKELDAMNNNHHLVGRGQEIDDIPGTPFSVIYDEGKTDEFDKIVLRGVDVTDYVSTWVQDKALQHIADSAAAEAERREESRLKARQEHHSQAA